MNSLTKDKTPSKKKPLLISGIVFTLFIGLSALIISNTNFLLISAAEYSLSRIIKGTCSIDELDYSLDPLQFNIKGLSVRSINPDIDYSINVPNLDADLTIMDSMGGRILIIKKIKIDMPSFESSRPEKIADIIPVKDKNRTGPSLLQKILAYLLFQDVRLETLDLGDGTITLSRNSDNIIIENIKCALLKHGSATISSSAIVKTASQKITAPLITLKSNNLMPAGLSEFQAEVDADNIIVNTPSIDMYGISLQSDISFNNSDKILNLDPIYMEIDKISSISASNIEPLENLHIETSLSLDLNKNKVWSENISIINNTINMQASLDGFLGSNKRPGKRININITKGNFLSESILSSIAPAKGLSDQIALSGPLSFKGQLGAKQLNDRWNIDCNIYIGFYDLDYTIYTGNNNSLKGDLNGTVDIKGDLPNIEIGIKVKGRKTFLANGSSGSLSLEPFAINTSIFKEEGSLLIRDFQSIIGSAFIGDISLPDIEAIIPSASLDLDKKVFSAPDISINSPLLKDTHIAVSAGDEIDITIIKGKLIPNEIPGDLISKYLDKGNSVSLAGPVMFKGNIKATKKENNWNLHNNIQAVFKKNAFSVFSGKRRIRGVLKGNLNSNGSFPGLKLSSDIKLSQLEYKDEKISIPASDLNLNFDGKYPKYNIREFGLKIPVIEVALKGNRHRINNILVTGEHSDLDLQKKTVSIPEIRVDSDKLKGLLLSFKGDPERFDIKAQISSGLINTGYDFGLIPKAWNIRGKEKIKLFASKKNNILSYSIDCRLDNLDIESPDSSVIGEKILLTTKIDGQANLSSKVAQTDTSIMINKGEFLFDRFYFDFKTTPFISSLHGKYEHPEKTFFFDPIDISFAKIINIQTRVRISEPFNKPALNISYDIPETPIVPVYESFILEPYKADIPTLDHVLLKGDISSSGSFAWNPGEWSINSNLKWQDGHISLNSGLTEDFNSRLNSELNSLPSVPNRGMTNEGNNKKIEIRDLYLDLPFQYQSRPSGNIDQKKNGQLSIDSLSVPYIEDRPLYFNISALPNRLQINSPVPIKIKGGAIKLDPVDITDILKQERTINTGFEVDIEDMVPYISGIFQKPVHGSLSGELRPLRIKGNNMKSSGKIDADLFNGNISLYNLAVDEILSSSPVFKLNVQWDDLNLREITKDTSFGEMTGIVHGRMENIEIAYGQPQKFDLLMETKRTKGIPQRISVKAVNNIAEISGGSSPFIGLAGIMASVINDFPYSKLGVRASLENDSFRISGTIKEKGSEYLIKRGRFSGVDVVNQNPDNRISFKDMLKRIQRVSSSKSGPVFK